MNRTEGINFQHMGRLRLLDLKAQKKNINYKQFFNIPLTFLQKIAKSTTIVHRLNSNSATASSNFRLKKQPKIKMSKLLKLSQPRNDTIAEWYNYSKQNNRASSQRNSNLKGIIKRCQSLQGRLQTNKLVTKFKKNSDKYFGYLEELSHFNFSKYEQELQ